MADHLAIDTERVGRIYKSRGRKERPAAARRLGRGHTIGAFRRTLRPAGPERRGQDHAHQDPHHAALPHRRAGRVAGFDVVREPDQVRPRISLVSGGESCGYGILTVRECLWMFAQFYGCSASRRQSAHRRAARRRRARGAHQHAVNRLSTGQRQRMNFARGF